MYQKRELLKTKATWKYRVNQIFEYNQVYYTLEQKVIIKTKLRPMSRRLLKQIQRKEITRKEIDELMKTSGNEKGKTLEKWTFETLESNGAVVNLNLSKNETNNDDNGRDIVGEIRVQEQTKDIIIQCKALKRTITPDIIHKLIGTLTNKKGAIGILVHAGEVNQKAYNVAQLCSDNTIVIVHATELHKLQDILEETPIKEYRRQIETISIGEIDCTKTKEDFHIKDINFRGTVVKDFFWQKEEIQATSSRIPKRKREESTKSKNKRITK